MPEDLQRFRHRPVPGRLAGELLDLGADDFVVGHLQHLQGRLDDRVVEHVGVGGGGDQLEPRIGESRLGQQVVGDAVGELGDRVGGAGCNDHDVGILGGLDVVVPRRPRLVGAVQYLVAAEGFEAQRPDEAFGGVAHHDPDLRPRLDEEADELQGFVGGDGAADAEKDLFAGEEVFGDLHAFSLPKKL